MVESEWPIEAVKKETRVLERRRYKWENSVNARAHAEAQELGDEAREALKGDDLPDLLGRRGGRDDQVQGAG